MDAVVDTGFTRFLTLPPATVAELGLRYRGVNNMVLPDRISLFHHPLEAVCGSVEELADEVRATIIHEIAHHVGWSDEDLERIEGR